MRLTVLFGLCAMLLPLAQAGTIVFSTDFTNVTGNGTFLSGSGSIMQSSPGNIYLQNTANGRPAAASRLVLTTLPGHSELDLVFTFLAIDSWDGISNPCCGSDLFRIRLDGVDIYTAAVRNYGLATPRFETETVPGAAMLVFGNNTSLLGNTAYSDSFWTITLTSIPHTASTATIAFFADGTGWDGGADESFGLDNITVQVAGTGPEPPPPTTDTPEPGSLILTGMAGVALLLVRGRRMRG